MIEKSSNKTENIDISLVNFRECIAKVKPHIKSAEVVVSDISTSIHEHVKISARMFTPSKNKTPLATLFYIPGTAFVARDSIVTLVICSHLCRLAFCQVIVINHRLAPENTLPIPYFDSYKAIKFFIKKEDQFSIIKDKIILIGYSSGGSVAAFATIKAKQEKFDIFISPLADYSRSLKNFLQYEEQDTDMAEEFVNWTINLCLPKNIDPRSTVISPFWERKEKIQILPSTRIIFAEFDRFCSDSELYYEKLLKSGVDVKKLIIEKAYHSFLWQKLEHIEKVAELIL